MTEVEPLGRFGRVDALVRTLELTTPELREAVEPYETVELLPYQTEDDAPELMAPELVAPLLAADEVEETGRSSLVAQPEDEAGLDELPGG
jgi:hypothetical protein